MFQCIVKVDADATKSLKTIANELTQKNIVHKLFAPGTLGKIVQDINTHQIGSISIRRQIQGKNVSILLFNTHKMKISGGINIVEDICSHAICSLLRTDFIEPIIQLLYRTDETFTIDKQMFNATMYRHTSIGKKDFIGFIDKLKTVFKIQNIIMPDIMRTNGNQRGRICAIKVKHDSGKGVFAVDHSGNVQFFSYCQMEDLQKHRSELMKVWL
jgi:hypothetical protein